MGECKMEPEETVRMDGTEHGRKDGRTDEATRNPDSSKVPPNGRMERKGEERERGGREGKKEGRILRREREKACVSNNSSPLARRQHILGRKQDKRPLPGTDKEQRSGKGEKINE